MERRTFFLGGALKKNQKNKKGGKKWKQCHLFPRWFLSAGALSGHRRWRFWFLLLASGG